MECAITNGECIGTNHNAFHVHAPAKTTSTYRRLCVDFCCFDATTSIKSICYNRGYPVMNHKIGNAMTTSKLIPNCRHTFRNHQIRQKLPTEVKVPVTHWRCCGIGKIDAKPIFQRTIVVHVLLSSHPVKSIFMDILNIFANGNLFYPRTTHSSECFLLNFLHGLAFVFVGNIYFFREETSLARYNIILPVFRQFESTMPTCSIGNGYTNAKTNRKHRRTRNHANLRHLRISFLLRF